MALKDLNLAYQGLQEATCFANGAIEVSPICGVVDDSIGSTLNVTLAAVATAEGLAFERLCSCSSSCTSDSFSAVPVISSRAEQLMLIVTDWHAHAWVGTVSIGALIAANDAEIGTTATGPSMEAAAMALVIGQKVANWRMFFVNLLMQVTRSAATMKLSKDRHSLTVDFSELHCTFRATAVPVTSAVVAWVARRLAQAYSQVCTTVEELRHTCRDLNVRQPKTPGGAEHNTERIGSAASSISPTPGSSGLRPASLVNPQSRSTTKRTRGMRIQ